MAGTLDRILSSNYKYSHRGSALPPQTVSVAEKQDPEWQKACMTYFASEARSRNKDILRDMRIYQMLDDEYDYTSHQWSVDPLNLGDKKEERYGATEPIQHYPIMNMPLNTILGERINRPIQFYCLSQAPESRNEYYRAKSENLFDSVMSQIQVNALGKLQKKGVQIDEQAMQEMQQNIMSAPYIQKYMDKDYADTIEQANNRLLKNVYMRGGMEHEFIEGFRHGTLVGKEAYAIEIRAGRASVKHIRNDALFYHKSQTSRWISEGQYAGYRHFLTPSSVLDMYRDRLTDQDFEALVSRINPSNKNGPKNSLTGIKSISYDTSVFSDQQGMTFDFINRDMVNGMVDEYYRVGSSVRSGAYGLIEVIHVYWKTYRKVGFCHYYDETDTEQKILVDENYEADEEKGEWVKWFYLNQVYEGILIDDDIVVGVGPYEHQIFDFNDPDYSPLPIEGGFYNDFSGKTISIANLMMPWQEMYDVVASELKKDLKKSIGQVMFMSIDNIPNVEGFDMEKWMYWCREFGIAWVGNNQRNQGNFSHYSAQDMSQVQQITSKMLLLDKIKMNCDMFGGFSQPRVAATSSAPTQGQDQQKLISSVNQTEYYFWKHTQIVQRVLTQLLNVSKKLLPKDKFKEYLYDDLEQRYIDSDIDKIINANCGLYVTYGSEAISRREAVRNLALSAAGKTGQAEDMADILLASTENEIRMITRTMRRRNQEQSDRDYQLQQQQLQQQVEQAKEKQDWEKEKHYTTLANNLQRDYIKSFAFQDDNTKDQDNSGVPDILEGAKLIETQMDNQRKHERDLRKIEGDIMTKVEKNRLEKQKLKIEEGWQDVERENMENDLEITKQQGRNQRAKPKSGG